jgi:hypothetical protein
MRAAVLGFLNRLVNSDTAPDGANGKASVEDVVEKS